MRLVEHEDQFTKILILGNEDTVVAKCRFHKYVITCSRIDRDRGDYIVALL